MKHILNFPTSNEDKEKVKQVARGVHDRLVEIRESYKESSGYFRHNHCVDATIKEHVDGTIITVVGQLTNWRVFVSVETGEFCFENDQGSECYANFEDGWDGCTNAHKYK